MHITHLGHACLLVETEHARVLLDPGTESAGFEELRDLTAILVTHQHDDHVDVARLRDLTAANPATPILVEGETAARLDGIPHRVVEPGDRVDLDGLGIDVVGGAHAHIYEQWPVFGNVGYVLDAGAFYHPGDALLDPGVAIDVLALPISGPWLKLGDAIGMLRAISPRVAVPMHEAALASTDQAHEMIGLFAPGGTLLRPLRRGTRTAI